MYNRADGKHNFFVNRDYRQDQRAAVSLGFEMTKRQGIAFIDGNYIRTEDAKISVFDLGFERSDVVYDVISTWKGLFFRLDDHLDRFLRSAGGFRLSCPYNRDEIKYILAECTSRAGLRDAYVKMVLTAGHYTGPERLDYRATTPAFFAFAIPYLWVANPEKQKIGLSVHIASTRRIPDICVDASYKNYHWGDLTRAQNEAREAGADIAVLCGITGKLAEAPGSNIFVWKGGKLFTPATNCLRGITRLAVFDLAKLMGVELETGDYPPAVLREADEAFLSSTAGGIMPVTRVDGKPLGDGKPGRRTMELRDLYWSKREAGWLGTSIADLLRPEPTASGRERVTH